MDTGGLDLFGTVEKLLNLGVPMAMLIVIVWLIIKYAPAAIKALQELGNSIGKNTGAVNDLKASYDLQIDRISVVTIQLKTLGDTIDLIESRQVKIADYDKLYLLMDSIRIKMDDLGTKVTGHIAETSKTKLSKANSNE